MRKISTIIEINFDHDIDLWEELNYDIILKEKKKTIIKEEKLPTRKNRNKPIDSSTKLF